MNSNRLRLAAMVAVLSMTFSISAEAEMVRAFWAGSVTDAVNGNAYELAIGNKLLAEMEFDTAWMATMNGFAPQDSLAVTASFFSNSAGSLSTNQSNGLTPIFSGEIRFLGNMTWQALDDANVIASGTWSHDSIKFEQRVIPLPAGLPLLLGALGVLTGLRRRA